MATDNESSNSELYNLLKVRGYKPVPLNSQNQRVKASQEADVIEFTFEKDGEDYGKAWISIDDAKNIIVYYSNEQQDSPSDITPGAEYDDTWTGFLKHLKQWAQRRQLSFELSNKDRLGDDMRQREYYKMKEKLGESYHPMGKKASYNDAVPNVKIVLQHNRSLEEGEARFRNVARIYLENVDGERFLAPTNKPGLARVYARHIAEGGVPNDEKWNHIKSICEEYQQMAGFVRATRKNQFNESAQQLVNEGINHYNNLRETLHKLAGHRGYHAYFESYTPALMEDDTDVNLNELFVQETMDPRIESVMPILSRLHKKVSESSSVPVDELAEWADGIINEKLELEEGDVIKFPKGWVDASDEGEDEDDLSWIPSEEEFEREEELRNRKHKPDNDVNEMEKDLHRGQRHDPRKGPQGPDKTAKMLAAKKAIKDARKALDKAFKGDVEENFINMAPQAVAEEEVDEAVTTWSGKGLLKKMRDANKAFKRGAAGWEKGMHDVDTVKAATKSLSPDQKEKALSAKVGKGSPAELQQKLIKREKNKKVDEGTGSNLESFLDKYPEARDAMYNALRHFEYAYDAMDYVAGHVLHQIPYSEWQKVRQDFIDYFAAHGLKDDVNEDLGPEQKRVGQLGPTEKVKNNNIGKLVGANESADIDPELARIIEMAKFKR